MRKVLLDENLPHALESELVGCDVWTVRRAGWAGVKNGELLLRADDDFDVFLTADRGIPHQQNLQKFALGFVLMAVGGTRIEDIRPFLRQLHDAINAVGPGQLVVVDPG